MYSGNGVVYNEEHSISFGDLVTRSMTISGHDPVTYDEFQAVANTWTDWHLIPSSRPTVAQPNPVLKIIDIPGSDEPVDLTTFLTGGVTYSQRQGSWSFYVVNGFAEHTQYVPQDWEALRMKIVNAIHGKKMKVCLMDDPQYYYEGRLTVGNWETGSTMSSITISYQLNPYKIHIINKDKSL